MPDDARIAATILELLEARASSATICPSDAARALARDETAWRDLMPQVRRVACRLVAEGALRVTQHGRDVDPLAARGPIRLGRPLHSKSKRMNALAGPSTPGT